HRFRLHAYVPRLICAGLSTTACAVLVANCGPGNPLNNPICPGPFPDQAFDQCSGGGGGGGNSAGGGGGGGGCVCGRPMVSKQNPVINTIGCPEQPCANMSWGVNFSLQQQAATCGWVIQEITINGPSGQDHYWEAFYIAAGATTTNGIYGFTGDDNYGS